MNRSTKKGLQENRPVRQRRRNGLEQALRSVRMSRLRYMLIFSLAPIFPNMKNSLVASAPRILNMDGLYIMGIAYSLGIGLIFLLTRPGMLHRVARVVAAVTALSFLGWVFSPIGIITPWLGLLFGLTLGASAGIALFAFTYALNDAERLIILVVFNSSLLLHMGPHLLNRHVPQHLPLIGGAVTLLLFVIFVLLSPVFSREMFVEDEKEGFAMLRRAQRMQEAGLTAREMEIVNLLLTGKMLKECAADMNISVDTVKFHTRNVYRKLGIQGRSELQSVFMDA